MSLVHNTPWQQFDWPDNIAALITDPPYSAKTEEGSRSSQGFKSADRDKPAYSGAPEKNIDYGHITPADAQALADKFAPIVNCWAVIFCDHIAWQWHRDAWDSHGWYTFAPVPWLKRNGAPRFQGDGPASMTEWIMVARPRGLPDSRFSRSGYYMTSIYRQGGDGRRRAGHKAECELVKLVKDYSEPGDLVCDPFAGTATVGGACIRLGRNYVGTEVDKETHAAGVVRLTEAPRPLPGLEPSGKAEQSSLLDLL
jgi:hypothetical protein